MKNLKKILCLFIAFLLILGFSIKKLYQHLASPPRKTAPSKIFVVSKGTTGTEIASRLKKEGLIRNPLVFRLILTKTGLDKKIQPGDFRLSATMSAYQIAYEFTSPLDIWVTVLEGWRAEEIGEYLVSKFGMRNSKFEKGEFLVEARSLEGYLFPDTYLIPKTATVGAVIKIMRGNFEEKFDERMREEAQKKGLSIEEVVNLASIIEREAKFDEDRPIVAGILIKRPKEEMPLQADATIQYATGYDEKEGTWWEKDIAKNLEIDSPYNTRKYFGLPPTPICNPGLASLKAVIYPKETDYWYYLSDDEGRMHYAVTLEEHIQNIDAYLK